MPKSTGHHLPRLASHAHEESAETRTTKRHDSGAEELRRLSGEPAQLTLKLSGLQVGTYAYTWDNVPIEIRADMVQAYNEKYRG